MIPQVIKLGEKV